MDSNGGRGDRDSKNSRDIKNKKDSGDNRESKENKPLTSKDQVVALKYDKNDGAPKVVAKGSGYLADRILGIAKEEDIPVYEDEQLVKNLGKLELGETIPPELFEIVAHIYAFVDRVDSLLEDDNNDTAANIRGKAKK